MANSPLNLKGVMMNIKYLKNIEGKSEQRSSLKVNPMQKLALGEITLSGGWLKGQLDLMCEGVTGRLPEYGPYFKEDRNGFLYPETASGWEEIPYWIRGFYPMAVLTENAEHLRTAQTYFEAAFASVQSDGWFGPEYLKE